MKRLKNISVYLAVWALLSSASHGAEQTGPAAQPVEPNRPAMPASIPYRPAPAQTGRIERDIVYCRTGDAELKLDLYFPNDPNVKSPPLVVFIHGGAWQMGNRNLFILPVLPELLKRGYAAASISYRLAPRHVFPAQIEDARCAVRFLRTHAKEYGINTERIGVWGESAGGHLASLLGLAVGETGFDGANQWAGQSSGVQAVVDIFGPANIQALGAADINRKVFGATSADDPILKKASPVRHVSKASPPFLIIHGELDRLVPVAQSQELHDKLMAAKADSTLVVVRNWGHGFAPPGSTPQPSIAEICRMVGDFFDKHLRQSK